MVLPNTKIAAWMAALAEAGIEYIEAGFPSSNPKHARFFEQLEREDLGDSKVAAFGMTRRRGIRADQDPALRRKASMWKRACS